MYDVSFFSFLPVGVFLFILYWKYLFSFITRSYITLIVGCLFHLLGGIGLVHIYNKFQNGIPFQFYFYEAIFGAGLTAGYILGYGILRIKISPKKPLIFLYVLLCGAGNVLAIHSGMPVLRDQCPGSMADTLKLSFSTKYLDTETGNYYYGRRYYSPYYRSFISFDPIEERGDLNLYGFCGNDPINKWDYLGLSSLPPQNDFFAKNDAFVNINKYLEVTIQCVKQSNFRKKLGVGGLTITTILGDQVPCDGGHIRVIIVPRIPSPKEMQKKRTNGDFGGIDDFFIPEDDFPDDLWGDPTNIGNERRGAWDYPIYEYRNAKFSIGRFIQTQSKGANEWSLRDASNDLFKQWTTSFKMPTGRAVLDTPVNCEERVNIQVGSKGFAPKVNRTITITK